MAENKKIINATPTSVNGIEFKSRMEATVYKYLVDSGYQPQYEPDTFVVFKGFYPSRPYFVDGKAQKRKLLDVTYTPDFKITLEDGKLIYIEVKGFNNDIYPYKRKMFLHYLETLQNTYFFEVHSKKGLISCLEKLKQL